MEPNPPKHFVPTADRAVRQGPDPRVTFVVLVSEPGDAVDAALGFAATQAGAGGVDVVAVHRGGLETAPWRTRYPEIRWVAAGAQATDDELRERGISEADGDIVRFLDGRPAARGWSVEDEVSG